MNDDDKEGSNRAAADGGKVLLNGIANQIKIFTYSCSCHPIHSTLHRVLASSNQPKLIRCIIHSNTEHCTALYICTRTEAECMEFVESVGERPTFWGRDILLFPRKYRVTPKATNDKQALGLINLNPYYY